MVADFPAGAEQGTLKIGNHIWIKETGKNHSAEKGKERVFRAEFEFEIEQMTGKDTVIGGTTVPGREMQRIHSTMEIHDGKTITCSGFHESGNVGEKRQQGDCSYSIKIESIDNHKVRLDVSIKDKCKSIFSDGSTRSRVLRLQASKTVKLGEKVKFDLTNESFLRVKATFEGVIKEKVED
jgi:hypothetical protein